jgi:Holliday junction resolvase RusA-like endonuclease
MNLRFTLPFPPSVNALFGGGSRQKRFPSKKYKEWLKSCPNLEGVGQPINHSVTVIYRFFWPDNRVRDGGNYIKAPLDYLVNQGVLEDDNWHIVEAELWKHNGVDKANPRVEIEIINDTK